MISCKPIYPFAWFWKARPVWSWGEKTIGFFRNTLYKPKASRLGSKNLTFGFAPASFPIVSYLPSIYMIFKSNNFSKIRFRRTYVIEKYWDSRQIIKWKINDKWFWPIYPFAWFWKPGLYEVEVKRLLDFAQYPLQTKASRPSFLNLTFGFAPASIPIVGYLPSIFKW